MLRNILLRLSVIVLIAAIGFSVLNPGIAEINTIFFIIVTETLALAMSGLALFAYSKVDFTEKSDNSNIGYIFLGVHVCVGLVVVGVYIAQI